MFPFEAKPTRSPPRQLFLHWRRGFKGIEETENESGEKRLGRPRHRRRRRRRPRRRCIDATALETGSEIEFCHRDLYILSYTRNCPRVEKSDRFARGDR